jgi:hypothetical protein
MHHQVDEGGEGMRRVIVTGIAAAIAIERFLDALRRF